MKRLLLIDRKFPFKSGEAFLENEINELSLEFDEINIFPIDAQIDEKFTRNITSKNVKVHPTGKKDYKSQKKKYLFNSFKFILSKKNEGKNIKQRFYEAFYLSICDIKYKEIINIISKFDISSNDEVYVYSYWLYTPASIAIKIKKYFENNGIKVIAISRAHRFDIYLEETKFNYLPQRNNLLKSLDHIYACSNNGMNYLKSKFPMYKEKIVEGYLGTYDHNLNHNKDNDKFVIVSCSRMSNIKRVDKIVKSLSILDKKYSQIKWYHIGSGELFNQVTEESKEELKNIEYDFLGAIPNVKVYEFYKNIHCDLFINVSSSEGLPVSIMEACSFGIPVIATNVGGTSEIVRDKENGILLNENFSVNELANEIANFIDGNYDCDAYRINARKLWENNFNAKINYKKFSDDLKKIYEEMVRGIE